MPENDIVAGTRVAADILYDTVKHRIDLFIVGL